MKPRYRYRPGLRAWVCFDRPLVVDGASLCIWPIAHPWYIAPPGAL